MTAMAARPTTYNGVPMRSRLEARFAAFLDRSGFTWEYEPRAFASEQGQYLPDFRVSDAGARSDMYVEVKGPDAGVVVLCGAMARMEIIHASEPRASLAFIVEQWLVPGSLEFMVMPWRGLGWMPGGVGLCKPAHRVHFWERDPELGPFPFCEHAIELGPIAAYLNPFAA